MLGTDGFGRSDTREQLRRYHRMDAESVCVAVLAMLSKEGKIDREVVDKAIADYGLPKDPPPIAE